MSGVHHRKSSFFVTGMFLILLDYLVLLVIVSGLFILKSLVVTSCLSEVATEEE
jgi:hypothetical protein